MLISLRSTLHQVEEGQGLVVARMVEVGRSCFKNTGGLGFPASFQEQRIRTIDSKPEVSRAAEAERQRSEGLKLAEMISQGRKQSLEQAGKPEANGRVKGSMGSQSR